MSASAAQIKADFDRIAGLDEEGWNHNLHYHRFLLAQLPTPCPRALDVGCGTGRFTREVAKRAGRVLGLDFAPEMVRLARERSRDVSNVRFEEADVRSYDFPRDHFDAVVSLTTLHHLPLRETLGALAATLRPGGVLAVLDIPEERSLGDYAIAACAAPVNLVLTRLHEGSWRRDPAVLAAWLEHAAGDVYLPTREVRRLARDVLPGSRVRRHLLWRYSIVWRKP